MIDQLPLALTWQYYWDLPARAKAAFEDHMSRAWSDWLDCAEQADPQAAAQARERFDSLPDEAQARFLTAPESYRRLTSPEIRRRGETIRFALDSLVAEQQRLGHAADQPGTWTAAGDFCAQDPATRSPVAPSYVATDGVSIDFVSPHSYLLSSEPPTRSSEIPQPHRASVVESLEQASRIIARACPPAHTMLATCVRVIVARRSAGKPNGSASSSWPRLIGKIGLQNPSSARDRLPATVASLVHEATHSLLYMVELADGCFYRDPLNATQQVCISPWSSRELPLHSFTHACFVWFALMTFWSQPELTETFAPSVIEDQIERCRSGFLGEELTVQLDTVLPSLNPRVAAAVEQLVEIGGKRRRSDTSEPVEATTSNPEHRETGRSRERVEVYFDPAAGEDVVFRNAWVPNYKARRLADRWFLSNPAGGWMIVDDAQYEALESVALPLSLFTLAESHHLVLTPNNALDYQAAYRRWTTPHFRHPKHHIVVSTLRCNLACSYCHAAVVPANAGSEHDLSPSVADAIIEFALNSRSETQSFEFQGGESLLNGKVLRHMIPRLRKAYREAGKRLYISIQTNATMLTDDWVAFFKTHDVRVGTSMDGPQVVHDAQRTLRSGRGTYERVRTTVKKHQLPVLPTITRNSLPHWREIVDQQLEMGSRVVAFQNVYPINSARENWDSVGIDMEEYLEIYEDVVTHLREKWDSDYYPLERRMYLAAKKLYIERDLDFADFGNPCGMVHSQIVYHHNGDIYTCDEGRDFPEFRLGSVLTDGYDGVVFGARMRELKNLSLPRDPECGRCALQPVCSTCPVYDRAVSGELTSRHAGTDKCAQTMVIYDRLLGWLAEDPSLLARLAEFHGFA